MKESLGTILIILLLFWYIDGWADCKEDNWDALKVSKLAYQGVLKEDLLAHLETSKEIEPERREKIKLWIDEVYSLPKDKLDLWWRSHHRECTGEDEA